MSDNIRPIHYQLEIVPDLQQFRFGGQVTIDLDASVGVDRVELNLLELAVWQCRMDTTEDGWVDCAFSLDPQEEVLAVVFPEARTGRFKLEIDYDCKINDQMAGFYRSGYEHEGQKR